MSSWSCLCPTQKLHETDSIFFLSSGKDKLHKKINKYIGINDKENHFSYNSPQYKHIKIIFPRGLLWEFRLSS